MELIEGFAEKAIASGAFQPMDKIYVMNKIRALVGDEDAEAHPAQPPVQRKTDMSQMRTNRNDLSTNGEQKANAPVVAGKKIGRNDPCPCGSGKKYKYCHGRGLV